MFFFFFHSSRYTPLDYALMGEHYDVAQYMIEQGALSIIGVQDIAAQKIQVWFSYCQLFSFFLPERKKKWRKKNYPALRVKIIINFVS